MTAAAHPQCLAEFNSIQVQLIVNVLTWWSLYGMIHMSFVEHAGLLRELDF